jgi:hypothetical protein
VRTDAAAKSIAIASPPSGVDEGWDAANALEDGWTPERAAELIEGAITTEDVSSSSWESPDLSLLDDRRGDLPAFPLDVFSPRWQLWSKNSAHGAGTAIDYVVVPLLGIASGLIGTARRLKASASWSQPFTLWTAQSAYPGQA